MLLWGSGCSSDTGGGTSPYAAEFERAIAEAESDYVKQALSDGQITAAEMQDARQHVVACLQQAGIEASYETDEYGQTWLTIAGDTTSSQSEAETACERQWMGAIEELYNKTTLNPRNEDWNPTSTG